MFKNTFFFLLLFLSINLFSQNNSNEPSWLYLKRAENFKEQKDYATAFTMARKAKQVHIQERLDDYMKVLFEEHREKTEYEIKKMVALKKDELIENDNFPEYHELIGDLYYLTNFLEESIKEYKIAIEQKKFFEYPQKTIEVKYKLANVYDKTANYELSDIIYREITESFFKKKKSEFWDRIKLNIKEDPTIEKVLRIYRIEGIEYLRALYKIGKRASFIGRNNEAFYYLSIAAVVWMTYYGSEIKKEKFDFQYSGPLDFINFVSKKQFNEYISNDDYIMDEILFFIGYVSLTNKEEKIADHYFNLSLSFTQGSKKEESIRNRINYLKIDKSHLLSYDEVID